MWLLQARGHYVLSVTTTHILLDNSHWLYLTQVQVGEEMNTVT